MEKHANYEDNHSTDCLMGAIYQTLRNTFGDTLVVEDIAKIQSLILPKNHYHNSASTFKETMPQSIFNKIYMEYEKEFFPEQKNNQHDLLTEEESEVEVSDIVESLITKLFKIADDAIEYGNNHIVASKHPIMDYLEIIGDGSHAVE